ncbi:hypothetical protein IL252_13830 [Halomicrobium sp. IBSBa]|uniref:hypothetical protein n=1 Tax=Halomicrobium sp. IBSBa TaxID=2778916 RepID=UPI001ABFD85E|nr:hypothetical protein [Halomicrobium sp. IBSBa]MBO4248897.1 hypothetical protein [Halomicrobium sp. IBSBa]
MTDFTYEYYRDLLKRLSERGYEFRSFGAVSDGKTVFLRHDVDWSPRRALEMAQLESDLGISSTYFFHLTSPLYNPLHDRSREILTEIESYGHEIGVHLSTHQYWDDDPGPEAVSKKVTSERAILSHLVDAVADATSFHIPPDWVLDVEYDDFTNTYEPRYFSEITYLADSNQRWREERPLESDLSDQVQMLVHPGLWAETDQQFVERLAHEQESRSAYVSAYIDEQYLPDNETISEAN